LIDEIAKCNSSEEAAEWARKRLAERDTHLPADAQSLEAKFVQIVSSFGSEIFPDLIDVENPELKLISSLQKAAQTPVQPSPLYASGIVEAPRAATPKPIRLRDKEHCRYVATLPCVVCGRSPTDPHHLRFAQPRALGRKVSDEYTVPVCRIHHRELHEYGDEVSWWAGVNVDPVPIALNLWQMSRSLDLLRENARRGAGAG
jgi:hypothetical protein